MVVVVEHVLWHRRDHARPAHLLRDQARDGKRDVADHLGLDAEPRPAGQEPVARIMSQRLRRHQRRLPIGLAVHDFLDELLLAPAVLDEVDGQPVEDVTVFGHGGPGAEVVGGLHEARAEERLPDPVDGHAGRERRLRVDEPPGESQPIAWCVGRKRMQRRGHVRADLAERLVPRAAVEEVRRAVLGMRPLGHVEHRGRWLRHLLPEGCDLVIDGREVGHALPPGLEDGRLVGSCAAFFRCPDREDRGMVERRGGRLGGRREADPAAGQHPRIASRHSHGDLELRALRQVEWLLELHHGD